MIYTGTDIIEIKRIKESIQNIGDNFIQRVFTETEIKYCEERGKSKFQHYAARFAAKEAVFKAISKSLEDKYKISWKNIDISNDDQGRPIVNFKYIKISNLKQIDISISHCKEYAIATVIAVFDS